MITICFTYEKITPESAAAGDYSESGFYESGGWEFPMWDENGENSTGFDYEKPVWKPGDLASAIREAQLLGICDGSGSNWFSSVDPDVNYQTGEDTFYSLHIDGCTASTLRRIARIITGEQ